MIGMIKTKKVEDVWLADILQLHLKAIGLCSVRIFDAIPRNKSLLNAERL